MPTIDDELELINEGATSDEWVKEELGSELSDCTPPNNNKQHHKVSVSAEPTHLRWEGLLGVRNNPDPLLDWDQLYNLQSQAVLRKDCQQLCKRLDSKIPSHELESLLTLYCKRRRLDYATGNGWLAIMEVLLGLPFDAPTLYNVFYAITTKYIPKETHSKAKVFDLFRLIMQYHDPQLCSFLDSLKIQPQQYATEWFNSLLSGALKPEICRVVWDHYFNRGDPFIMFFVALSFLQCTRDQLLQMTDKAKVVETIRSAPSAMDADDIADLFEVCVVTLNCSPTSLRQDFHCLLFGSNLVDDFTDFPLNRVICFPVSVQEIFKRVIDLNAAKQLFTYFMIDTRPHASFTAGSIFGAYNLNAKLIVDEPESFRIAMTSLMQFKATSHPKEHICFVGSGNEEEDAFMFMAISRFLQQNVAHISYVDGGYKAIHAMLKETNNLAKLNNHLAPENCVECRNGVGGGSQPSGWSLMERMKKAVAEKKDAVKSKVQTIVELGGGAVAGGSGGPSPPTSSKPIRHVKSSERNGKRYKNVQSVFSINDDSDLSDDELAGNLVASTSAKERLKWADLIRRPDVYKHFEGHEIFQDKSYLKCSILITLTHMHIYHDIPEAAGFVRLHAQHPLPTIMRVTSKRRVPEFLTFKFGAEMPNGETNITRVHCFLLSKSGDCASAIKQAMHRLGTLQSPTASSSSAANSTADSVSTSASKLSLG